MREAAWARDDDVTIVTLGHWPDVVDDLHPLACVVFIATP